MAEHQAKLAAREAKAKDTGKKPGGRPPQPPDEGARPTDQINLTDEASRIMPVAGGGFDQCYNAQAVVAADSLLVVAAQVVQAPNDKQQIEPMLTTSNRANCRRWVGQNARRCRPRVLHFDPFRRPSCRAVGSGRAGKREPSTCSHSAMPSPVLRAVTLMQHSRLFFAEPQCGAFSVLDYLPA